MPKKNRHELVEDVELLMGTDTPGNIAARLGRKPDSVARSLQREGRNDLARPFWAAAWKDRSRPDGARPRGQDVDHDPGVRVAAGHNFEEAA